MASNAITEWNAAGTLPAALTPQPPTPASNMIVSVMVRSNIRPNETPKFNLVDDVSMSF